MLVIDLGSYAKYLSDSLQVDLIVPALAITLFISVAIYIIFKRIPIINNIIGVFVVTSAISTVLAIPLIIFFEFLELSLIKRVLILIVAFVMVLLFSIFNSREILKFVKESQSFNRTK